MLVDVDFRSAGAHPILAVVASVNNKSSGTRKIQTGIYENGHWSFELQFRGRQDVDLDFPDLGEFDCTGVCDSPEQLVQKLPSIVTEGPDKYVVSMVKVRKINQSPDGGWRWHKWGSYIGERTPQCEYLYDEPDIDEVWTYHVYKVAE